ncbi:hypothetical protein ACA910_014161 [Epithemia clementina (nom. ined.)]
MMVSKTKDRRGEGFAKKASESEEPFTNVVAKGVHRPSRQTQEKLQELRDQVATSSTLQQFALGSSQVAAAEERRKILQADDQKPKLSTLSEKQRLALERRKGRRDRALQSRLEKHETRRLEAAVAAAQAKEILETTQPGMIETENDMEKSYSLTQAALKRDHLDPEIARNIFDLTLTECAPYGMKYDSSGRYSVLYGEKGHVAYMDNHQRSLVKEFNVHERVRDACFLHNFTLTAVAQKNHAFIYDHNGIEIHRLSECHEPLALDFLPYHWLLVSIGRTGWLKYQDTSTGQHVASHRTHVPCRVLRQNPANAVMHVGHSNGTVSLWSPATSTYLVKMLCHKGSAITSIAIDQSGHTMVTGGADRKMRIWDLRTYKQLNKYDCVAGIPTSLDISQRGMVAVGHAGHVSVWPSETLQTRTSGPYMHQLFPRCSPIETVRFRPFEDVCGVGHAMGISSMVIPGSGEPQIDTSEYHLNPMADSKQRREAEVRALLDKLRPEMIALDPDQVAGIEASDPQTKLERLHDLQEEANAKVRPVKRVASTKRGQSKIQVKLRRKLRNVVKDNRGKLRESKKIKSAENANEDGESGAGEQAPPALKRFFG